MSLDVLVRSTDRDLTTTSAMRAFVLGATATSTSHDAYLSAVIRRASQWAETYIGFPLTVQTYEETVAGYGGRRLMLSRTPLRAVDRIFDATDTGDATEITTTSYRIQDRDAGFLSRDQGWPWSATLQGRFGSLALPLEAAPAPGDETEPWFVTYRAGWTYGGIDTGSNNWSTVKGSTSTGRTLPEDIEEAVLMRGQKMFEGLQGVTSESLADLSVSYEGSAGANDEPEEMILAPYRRFV